MTRFFLDTLLEDSVYPGSVTLIYAGQYGKMNLTMGSPTSIFFNPFIRQRWPSVRPEDVVPKVSFKATVQGSNEKKDFDAAITTRTKWKRGLRDTSEALLAFPPSVFGAHDIYLQF